MKQVQKRQKNLKNTNKELQKWLDEEKWIESEQAGIDRSGLENYCEFCEFVVTGYHCSAPQEKREKECLCAKAYRVMKKKGLFSKM
jgi:hypothetical protein